MFISVIGGSDCSEDEKRLAEEVGQELARRGATLICGGLGGVQLLKEAPLLASCQGTVATMPILMLESPLSPAWAMQEMPLSPSRARRLLPLAEAMERFPRSPMLCKMASPLLASALGRYQEAGKRIDR